MAPVIFSLEGEVALVTGAASGIGRAIAEAIADSGAPVGLVDLTEQASADTAEAISEAGGRCLSIAADVTQLAQLRAAVDQIEAAFGPLSLAVNSAGIANAASAEAMPLDQWQRVYDVDVLGACDQRRTSGGRSHRSDARKMSDTWTLIPNFAAPQPIAFRPSR
jgi:NAD(P)-dependent dehydrogenase (short-subunit alcohol dehydrogenase family)